MPQYFKDFDFSDFWNDTDFSLEKYVDTSPSDELIKSIEGELGYSLPPSYIELMKMHNGGKPVKNCFPTEKGTSWAADHIQITGFLSIGRNKIYSLCGELGSQFKIDEWGYPNIGVYICDTPSAGHDIIMLDYSKCGKDGEPEVVHVDQEMDYEITFLAKDFETFVRGLVHEDVYDTSEEDLKTALLTVEEGTFSEVLSDCIRKQKDALDYEKIIRAVCRQITTEKGHFSLHAEEKSHLMYDIQFLLYSKAHNVKGREQYLEVYPSMITFGNGTFSMRGYAPDFVKEWMEERIAQKAITKSFFSGLKFTSEYELKLKSKMLDYL